MKKINKYILLAFVTGFSVMTIELTATRIIAPIVGNSIYTWTTIIGIVLLGGSLGNHMGGKMIDKRNELSLVATLLLLASSLVMFIPILAQNIRKILSLTSVLWLATAEISTFLFLIPAFVLGMIYPMVFKQYLRDVKNAGKDAGTFSASWSAGSIMGTFFTGFLFIGYLGTVKTLLLISLLLFASSLCLFEKKMRFRAVAGFLFVASLYFFIANSFVSQAAVYEDESNYYKIKVVDSVRPMEGKVRMLFLDIDSHSIESRSGKQLDFYTGIAPVFSVFNKNIKDIAVIGGGSLELSSNFKKNYPDSNVTTLEIDKEVTEVADKYFNASDYIIENTVDVDGRTYLSRNDSKYDIIFSDAYNSYVSVPWHLSTKEFFAEAKEKLNKNGVFAINFISAREGKSAGFYKSMLATFNEIFDNYYVFSYGSSAEDIQNIVLIGLKSQQHISGQNMYEELGKLPDSFLLKSHFTSNNISVDKNAMILTDDFAPTDRMMMPIMDEYFKKSQDSKK